MIEWRSLPLDCTDIESVYASLEQRGTEFVRPWSIAELRLGDEDIDWLTRWFAALPSDASIAGPDTERHVLPRCEFAALMLVLGAERCRRHSRSEDAVWPTFSRLIPVERPIWSELFHPNRQPTWLLREAIVEAARALNLRNVIDVEGTQQWYMTVKLQFGFTHMGAKRRLAEWLVGLGAPHAVLCLGGQSGNAELTSDSFRRLWTTLRQYRRGYVSEAEAREVLEQSPWVRPNWIEDLLPEARARIETLGRGDESDIGGSGTPSTVTPEERGALEAIALSWPPGGRPRIVFRLDREAITEECENARCTELDFLVDGQRTSRWLRQEDGTWEGPDSVTAELGQQPAQVNLAPKLLAVCAGSVGVIRQWDLADFGLVGDVLVFNLDEDRLIQFGENRLDPNTHYALVCDRAYTVEGCTSTFTFEQPGSGRKAIRLPVPLTGNVKLSYEGFTIWQPVAPDIPGVRRVAATLTTPNDTVVTVGERTRLVVKGLPGQASDVRLLLNRRVMQMAGLGDDWVTEQEVTVTPELASKQAVVRLRCQIDERSLTLVPSMALRLLGIAVLTSDARHPEAQPNRRQLAVGDVISRSTDGAQLRIWVPDDAAALRVFEGPYCVGCIRHGKASLKDFPGLGGKLAVRGAAVHVFEHACVDGGCFRDFNLLGIGGQVHIGLCAKMRPQAEHQRLVALLSSDDGRVRLESLPQDVLLHIGEEREWRVTVPQGTLALALAWRGVRQGACWDIDRLSRLRFEPNKQMFAAIRWLQLPVLHRDVSAWLGPLVLKEPFAFIEAWYQDKGLPTGMELGHEPARDTAIRLYLGHWKPLQDAHCSQAVRMLTAVEPQAPETLLSAALRVGRFSLPLLWWAARKLARAGGTTLHQAVRSLLNLTAADPDRLVAHRLDSLQRSTMEYCAFDEARLTKLCDAVLAWLGQPGATLAAQDHDDLLLAQGSESGLRFLAAKTLLHHAQREERTR
jgi:hypothetical protein